MSIRELWGHQKQALLRFRKENEAALFHEMGTGKTTTAIHWMRGKWKENDRLLPTLIVSPIATLEGWKREIGINAPKALEHVEILKGSSVKRIAALEKSPAKIFITNPEAFAMTPVVQAIRRRGFPVVVIDESHRFKNYKSKRLQELLTVTDLAVYRMILSGTPILNSYTDLWAQWRILDLGESLGRNFFLFRRRFFVDANAAWAGRPKYFPNWVPAPGSDVELTELTARKSSRVTKLQCLDLPPVVYKRDEIPMSPEQERLYRQMESDLIASVKSGDCVATNALTQVLRLLQILSGYAQLESGKHRVAGNPRLERLRELLEELTPAHKVIVWVVFEQSYEDIATLCKEMNLGYAELTGRTKDRQAEINRFRDDPLCRVFIGNPQAGGVGVDGLQVSDYAIYYSRNYSLGDRLQSEARNHRGGSEIHAKVTLIDLVVPGTLDEVVLDALLRKENLAESILEKLKALS